MLSEPARPPERTGLRHLEVMRSEPRSKPHTTRRQLAFRQKAKDHRRRSFRVAIVAGAFLAIAGLVAGGNVAVSTGEAKREQASATTALAESTGLEREQLAVYDEIATVQTHNTATIVLGEARQVLAATGKKVDASTLASVTATLAGYKNLPVEKTESLTAKARAEIASVTTASAAADRATAKAAAAKAVRDAAAAKKAAAKAAAAQAVAARKAAAQAAVAAKAAAKAAARVARKAAADAVAAKTRANRSASLAGSNSAAGARATASNMAASRYGWGSGQFSCLSQLWQKESGWNYRAYNASSGATGIPQALPGSKMASAGSDWATNASTQIAWGLNYIKSRYGTPCAAWEHSRALNWY